MGKARLRRVWPVPRTRKPNAWPAMRAANRRPTNQGWWRLANSRRREPPSRSKLTALDIFGGRHSASWLRSAGGGGGFTFFCFLGAVWLGGGGGGAGREVCYAGGGGGGGWAGGGDWQQSG